MKDLGEIPEDVREHLELIPVETWTRCSRSRSTA
jgi:hypothetical protein